MMTELIRQILIAAGYALLTFRQDDPGHVLLFLVAVATAARAVRQWTKEDVKKA
jgi:hypothetical protein